MHLIFFVLMAERLFCIHSRTWITQSFVRLPMKWRDIIMRNKGRGYPDGLAGEQIPLHARIMAIADVFDAVSQKRR